MEDNLTIPYENSTYTYLDTRSTETVEHWNSNETASTEDIDLLLFDKDDTAHPERYASAFDDSPLGETTHVSPPILSSGYSTSTLGYDLSPRKPASCEPLFYGHGSGEYRGFESPSVHEYDDSESVEDDDLWLALGQYEEDTHSCPTASDNTVMEARSTDTIPHHTPTIHTPQKPKDVISGITDDCPEIYRLNLPSRNKRQQISPPLNSFADQTPETVCISSTLKADGEYLNIYETPMVNPRSHNPKSVP
ncbi:hypothetical protein FQN49_001017 [Arthroderma sp. PD_2]|nr:hypothetical protein FQN49_001017 [Arthroderma sp. PD_2]